MAEKKYSTGIVWLRQDLRLADNPALVVACKECEKIVVVFIDDPASQTISQLGEASKVWLHHSLCSIDADLNKKSQSLICLQGDSYKALSELIDATKAASLYWNRCYDPVTMRRDKKLKLALGKQINVASYNGLLLREPWDLSKPDGTPYRVFTPFWRKLLTYLPGDAPLPAPRQIPAQPKIQGNLNTCSVSNLGLLPLIRWDQPMLDEWQVGSAAAQKRLEEFLSNSVDNYDELRNRPDSDGTSKMSPHLHFGEISARQIIHAIYVQCPDVENSTGGAFMFAKEIGWREFAYHLIYHFPGSVSKPLDQRFSNFPWERVNPRIRRAWETGHTGVPIVDAGMRQLWQSGWMHNRVRMIVGSYLVKNLLLPWQVGESWFRNTLIDADLASNVMGWQWVAGSGADAAPYFRIFNPVLQGEKFDPEGSYVKRWVPELRDLELAYIHKPWELPLEQRPVNYPEPLVCLKASRTRALLAFDQIKTGAKTVI